MEVNDEVKRRKRRKRRGNWEGTIKDRKDGRKEGQIMLGGKRHYVYGATDKEVQERIRALVRDYEAGVDLSQREIKLSEYLERWLAEVVKTTNGPRTYEYYRSIVEKHINPALGNVKLRALTPSKVSAFLTGLPSDLSSNTRAKIRGALRTALNNAIQWRLVEYNAAALARAPKITKFEAHVITPEEARRFREVIREHPQEGLYLIGMTLGLRKGELLGLRKADVDLKAGLLYIRGQAQSVNGEVVWKETKTEQSRRVLPIPKQLYPALQKALEYQPEVEWLFPSRAGTLITPRNLVRQFKYLLRKAGLSEKIRVHDLRHFAATNLLRNGARIEEAREVLGHTEVTTTLNYYAHALPDELRTAVTTAANRLLGEVDEPI